MIIEEFTVTAFQQHTRILGCEQTRRAICIDPGDDSESIVSAIDRHGFELQAIFCTHAHLDHCGRLPMLPPAGFKGPIYATPATIELCDLLLRDTATLQESDATVIEPGTQVTIIQVDGTTLMVEKEM